MYTDSHCHIEDIQTLTRAENAGVTTLLNAGKDLDEIAAQLELCRQIKDRYQNKISSLKVWTSAGIHPDSAPVKLNKITTDDIVSATANPFVVAIGECGLDYHYGANYKTEQKEMFSRHIKAAGITGLPLMIHQREAEEDTLALLKQGISEYGHLSGVIHCFTSTKDFAAEINKLGFYISASGIITFKSAEDIAAVFKDFPLDKILIETDSPYLAPVPYRGQTNEPAYIIKTAEKLASIRETSVEKIADITTNNFYRLYQKASNQRKETSCQK